jgi:plastocyanin
MKFMPERLEVAAGETVTWINADLVPHTVTAANAGLESGTIAPGARWTFVVKKPGKLAYICRFHPGMRGELIVQ